ncbi:winged helix-turn-helix domain-containing protein [Streptosporangiaceae bacterium NEAU-GS5]|nr:winged helix-turn-helix domain-containing protein [Streptosporangiaceae bacterium NEAU-GS5]
MRVGILGALEVTDDTGAPVVVGGQRVRALLAMLALEPGKPVAVDRLVDALWGEEPPGNAANALQTLVSRLRAALAPAGSPVLTLPGAYALDVPPDDVDASRFAGLVATGPLDEALGLWRGPALADLRSTPHLANVAARLDEQRLDAVETRAEARLSRGLAVDLSADAAEHPLRERLCALAMRGLAAGGRQADALALFERTRAALAEQLGIDPGPELRAAHLAVLRGETLRGQTPHGGTPTRHSKEGRRGSAVKAPLTSFVGREQELGGLAGLLGEHRLVTVVGPGGAGKTRLAVETALRSGESELRLAELAPVADPVDVAPTLVNALGLTSGLATPGDLRPAPDDPLAQLGMGLGERRVLVVLDNCEHVVGAAARVVERLLHDCPGVRVLATSREPLGVPGEVLFPIPPLGLPPAGAPLDDPGDIADAAAHSAVRLLVERARAVKPGFVLDHANLADVVAICRHLDGMPLAIELAAARLRALTPAQLASRLDDRFRLLTGGSRTALPRHQTLRAVVEWSWDLLTPDERDLAERFAVFAGSAMLDDVEAVCGTPETDVLKTLPSLVDKSLVEVADDGRYRMLETIRAFALEEAGELAEAFRRRHAVRFLNLAETAEPRLRTADQLEWIARLITEQDNLHAALRWAIDRRDVALAVRLCGTLSWFWWLRGYRAESAVWIRQTLALAGDEPPEGLVRAYVACQFARGVSELASIVSQAGAVQEIHQIMEELIQRAVAEGPVHPMLLVTRVVMAAMAGKDAMATELIEEYAASDDRWLASSALMLRGSRGDVADLEAAAAGFRAIGDRWGLSEALINLATLRASRGEPALDVADEVSMLTSGWISSDESISMLARLATLRAEAGDIDGAMADLEKARAGAEPGEIQPHSMVLLMIVEGDVARIRGDLAASLEIHERVAAELAGQTMFPQLTASALSAYAKTLIKVGRVDEGRARLKEAYHALGHAPDLPILGQILMWSADVEADGERAAALRTAAESFGLGLPRDELERLITD